MKERCIEKEMTSPIVECPKERVCDRYIMHNVDHVIPINTRIVNHHVYRHSFRPVYTTCECDVIEECINNNPML